MHHFCVLAGYGAEAVNPYLAFETLEAVRVANGSKLGADEVAANYVKAVGKGILKVMSKMGISTYQSYCGAQIFDAVGLSSDFVERYFTGTASLIEGVGLAQIAREGVQRHRDAYGDAPLYRTMLDAGGAYAFRLRGEEHAWTPESVASLQHAVRGNLPAEYQAFAAEINERNERLLTLRGLMRFRWAEAPIPLEEVEPAGEIVKRFATGAMSFGSISREAHTTLAIAMNRIGGRSNTGEGGEETDRFKPLPNGDSMRSAIKQVASGRFGVTAEYLVNADDIQIKMAQGAKPGEGGQLPGHKVDKTIARVRHATPGVGLISPPPHHDIYSIEDLAQLIHDLKNVNPAARISVKLVSEVGVGTVAAGVAKARADHVTISGFEGAPAPARSPRSPMPARPGKSAWPRRSRPCCSTASRPHRGAGGRRPADRPGRRRRRPAGRRRIRLRHRPADRGGLHHDAQVPPQHLPGGGGDPGSGPARPLHRRARAHHQLLLLRRRGAARDHGAPGLPHRSGDDRPGGPPGRARAPSSTGRPGIST